jgi:thioredoxin-related protein
MKKIIVALLLVPFLSVGQTTQHTGGMKFEHGLSWKEIQAKAKAENKFIIMDCFTTWCGPCTYMTDNIFPLPEVGAFFNDKYLAVKVQFDTTKNEKGEIKDNDEVKAWFKDMEAINAQYKIRAYPTYLFFAPNGEIVHRAVGSSDAKTFIAKGENAMNPEKQYYTQLKKYESGKKDPEFLRTIAMIASDAYDMPVANSVSKEYLATQTNLITKENLEFLLKFTESSTDIGFKTLLENQDKADALVGKGKAKAKLQEIILYKDMWTAMRKINIDPATVVPDYSAIAEATSKKYPQFASDITVFVEQQTKSFVLSKSIAPAIRKINADKTITSPDYTASVEEAVKKYPGFASDIKDYADKQKISFYLNKKEWSSFKEAITTYIATNGEGKLTPGELNSYAWAVFENCKDMTCVTEALEWSKRSFADNKNPGFMDTYANILHKLGRTKEAIEVQEQAVALGEGASKKNYQETLDKMKKGEKTWSEK